MKLRMRATVLAAGVVAALAAPLSAHEIHYSDPKDTPYSRFDVRNVALGHTSAKVYGSASTWNEGFTSADLHGSGNGIYLKLDTDPDRFADYSLRIHSNREGELVGAVFKRREGPDRKVGNATIGRTEENGYPTVTMSISREMIKLYGSGYQIHYRWFSRDRGYRDNAPNGEWQRLTI